MGGPRTDVRRRRRRGPWIAAILILLLLGGTAGAVLATHHTAQVRVPSLVGLKEGPASKTLRNLGLGIGSLVSKVSPKPAGTILETKPRHGTLVSKGKTVSLVVSLGPSTAPVTVKDVVTESVFQAESDLSALGLNSSITYSSSSNGYTPGTVIYQNPVGGTSARTGQTVNLVVVAAGTSYSLNNVAGDTQVGATQSIANQGLTVSSTTSSVCSNTIPVGDVVSTLPVKGTLVTQGQSIELVTSSGVCNVSVPNVRGDTQAEADSALEASSLGLVPNYIELSLADPPCSTDGPDYVESTNPPQFTEVKYGSSINVNYCPPASTTTSTTTTTTSSMP
jgi:serine/threonine-protein kinase